MSIPVPAGSCPRHRPGPRRWLAGLAALAVAWSQAAGAGPQPLTLQLKWHHQFQFAGYYAAQAKGYYAAAGLVITIREGSATQPAIPAVLGGAAQFGISDTDVLLARLGGRPLVVCAAIFQHSPYVVMSRRDRGIRTPADLVGARVMLSGDQGAAQFLAMMANEGINASRVSILPHSWNLDDLVAGRVDAVSAYASVEPALLRARGVEPAILRSVDYGVDFYGDVLFTTEAEVAAHPKRTAAFVDASLRGWNYAFEHPEEIADLILGLPGVRERGVTREQLLNEAREMRALILPEVVEIGHMNPGRWRQIAGIYTAQGLVPRDASLDGFVYDRNPPQDFSHLWWTSGATLAVLLVLGLVVLWNMQMRRSVRIRTQELRDSEERFRQLAENITEVFWISDVEKGRILYVSPAYAAIWGRACEDLYAVPGSWLEAIHADDREQVRTAAMTRQASGGYSEVYRIVRPDGAVRWIHDRAFPVRDAAGRVYRIVGIAADITERKAAEQRIAEQAALLDLAQDAIVVCDLDQVVRYWNKGAERIYGWSAAERVGRPITGVMEAPEITAVAREQVLARGEWRGELRRQTKSGQPVTVESRWSLVHDEQGRPKSTLSISTDITERRQVEQQLLRTQRLESIGTLAGGIAHDLNNLLSPILMGVGLLRQLSTDPLAQRMVDTIERSAQRGSDLVRQVLSFSRGVEGGRMNVHVRNLARELQSIIHNTFPKNIAFECNVPAETWLVSGDPTQLSQVLLNLCVNARDAMPQGGRLAISARNLILDAQYAGMTGQAAPGRYLCIDVADTGAGIPANIRHRIFDPFFTTKPPGKGTGLGLSTVLGIVRAHGGFVNVDSAPGRGSVFHVFLPALTEDAAESAPVAPAAAIPPGNGELILVVDDETAILTITRHTLEAAGYRVLTAEDGAQAVGAFALQAAEIRLVLTDLAMPIMDGSALVAALQRLKPRVRVVVMTGVKEDPRVAALAHAGVRDVLAKPYTASELLRLLHRVLAEDSAPPFTPKSVP